ncbi:MAG: hypothetical protein OER85_03335 [Gammaproteobacteria bacterium]|nr:hypothetical protein [Gammaproteobacteria bacterium]
MRRIDAPNNPLVWIVGGALIASWFYGAYHAYKDHEVLHAAAALFLPPYGLYMAAEQSFGHSVGSVAGRPPAVALPVAEMIEANASSCRESESWRRRTGLSEVQFAVFCTCIWKFVIENFPPNENEYVDQYGKNSPRLEQIKKRATEACLISSQNLVAPLDG